MAMTYEDVLKNIQAAGLENQFSQYDLNTAREHPEFGASMLSIKQDWNAATDQAGRTAANQAAEALRRQYGSYLGGIDGSKYYALGPSPGSYQSPYQQQIQDALDRLGSYESFDYGPAPTYNNRYQAEIDSLLDRVQNYEDFTWSKDTDPAYSAYAKQYRREGQRATEDALAAAAAATGGQISTAAITAASQAGDYYAGQLAEAIPQLYEAAYSRYLSEYSKLVDQLNQTQQQEQMDYNKYLTELGQYNTDRNLGYQQWLDEYSMLGSYLGALQGQDSTEYDRLMDQVDYNRDQQSLYQAQVDAILQAGGLPSTSLVGQSGYSDEYIQAIRNYYAAQQAAAASGGGRSGGGGSSGGGSEPTESVGIYQQLYDMGIRTEDDAYAALLGMDYSNTEELELSSRFKNWMPRTSESGLSPAAQAILNSYRHVNPGTASDVRAVFADRIETALREGTITESDAEYLLPFFGY